MTLHCKQTFLPSHIPKLVDEDEILDECQNAFTYGSNNGFDNSGRYFSIYFKRGNGLSMEYNGSKVMMYRFEDDGEKIGVSVNCIFSISNNDYFISLVQSNRTKDKVLDTT